MGEGVGNVLVVDDNPGDRRFITEVLRNSRLDVTVHTVKTRDEALDLLYQRGEYEDGPVPDVIFLDWNLSRETGEEVAVAANSGDSRIPVVVMTGTKSERRAVESSVTQADEYIQKPTEPEGYIETLRSFYTDR